MDKHSKKILIVDDLEDIREGISFILKDAGYNVIDAENGVKALTSIESNKVDLIITDILMPEMDGIELVRKVREVNPSMVFILISGGGRPLSSDTEYNYLDSAQKLTGIDAVFKKPFKPEELLKKVDELLQT